MAIDGCNDQLRRVFHPHQRLVAVQTEEISELRGRRQQHLDVRARAEEFIAGAADDYDMNVFIEPSFENRIIQIAHHFVCVGVRRRVVQFNDRNAVLSAVVDQLVFHRFSSHDLVPFTVARLIRRDRDGIRARFPGCRP